MNFAHAASLGCLLVLSGQAEAAEKKVMVFDFYLDNTSMEPTSPAEAERIKKTSDELRDRLQKSGSYDVINGTGKEFASVPGMGQCSNEELAAAQKAGADLVACSWVQKVSNLILNMNTVIEDAKTGQQLIGGSVDMRGNTDQSWDRGLKYMLEEHVLKPGS
jgi:hypothetical protein